MRRRKSDIYHGGTCLYELLLLLLPLLLCAVSSVTCAEWNAPYFSSVPYPDPGVKFISGDGESQVVNVTENLPPVGIVMMNYNGTTAPNCHDGGGSPICSRLEAFRNGTDYKWVIHLTSSLDFEAKEGNLWAVYKVDSAEADLFLVVQNVNDNDPVVEFIGPNENCSVDENSAAIDCRIKVYDADGVNGISINVTTSVGDNIFSTLDDSPNDDHTKHYALVMESPLDYEKVPLRSTTITATDTYLGETRTGQTMLVVWVNDLPDEKPNWLSSFTTQSIDEETTWNFIFKAEDGDRAINANISYSLEFNNNGKNTNFSKFSINDKTGVFMVNNIDRDVLSEDMFKMTVTAYETEDNTSNVSTDITIFVNDVNDNTPKILPTDQYIIIDEETSMTLNFPEPFIVSDPDLGENAQFKIALEESKFSKPFLLVPDAGYQSATISLSVINSSALDYEEYEWRNISLKVIATELKDTQHSSCAQINIELRDRNDEFPVFNETVYDADVREDAELGALITTVYANDRDDGDIVTYSITQRVMAIDSSTGEVTVSAENAFDYERQQNVMVQVTATDKVDHQSTAQINITVKDVNDVAPTLYLPNDDLEIQEHAVKDSTLDNITVNATDPDSTSNLVFFIDWEKSSASKQGRRISNSSLYNQVLRIQGKEKKDNEKEWQATLIVNDEQKLDWEVFDTLYLVVSVNDTNTEPKYVEKYSISSGTLPFTILDINDNQPEFTQQSIDAKRSVEENSDPQRLIGSVIATDKDSEENGNITYSIVPLEESYPPAMVIIDSITGEISTGTDNINCEDFQFLLYNVFASDGSFTNNITINITVIDKNDNAPMVDESGSSTFSIPENTDSVKITTINATDADVTSPYNLLFYKFEDDRSINTQYFKIDNATGIVEVALKNGVVLDREDKSEYTLTFIVLDNYENGMNIGNEPSLRSNPTKITVKLLDENDNPPTFNETEQIEGCHIKINEDHAVNETIYSGKLAEDKDEKGNKNSEFDYFLENVECITDNKEDIQDLFIVTTVSPIEWTVEISANHSLMNYWGKYQVTISARDHGEPPLTGNGTYIICINDVNNYSPVITYPANDSQRLLLSSNQEVGQRLVDVENNAIKDLEATDEDDRETNNGKIKFIITGDDNSTHYFDIKNGDNRGQGILVLLELPSPNMNVFELTIRASDMGDPSLQSDPRKLRIVFVNPQNLPPKFTHNTQILTFPENKTTLTKYINEAYDESNNGLNPEDDLWQDIKYHITGGNEKGLFELDDTTRELTIVKELDYEQEQLHNLTIEAFTNSLSTNPDPNSLLHLTVQVEDVNDEPPVFSYSVFYGVFLVTDDLNKEIVSLNATDKDTNDTLTFKMNLKTMIVSDASLNAVKDSAFCLDKNLIKLGIRPNSNLKGSFSFDVEVQDSMSPPDDYHSDTAQVQIFVLTQSYIVEFNFLNSQDEIEGARADITNIFTEVFQCVCGVDNVVKATDDNGKPIDSKTVLGAHFLDAQSNQPIEKNTIIQKVNDFNTYNKLSQAFLGKNLKLVDYALDTNKEDTIQQYLQTILISVSAVLGIMVLVLFVAFFIRTRTLNKRLEKLSTTKFGSQDSGLNRVGMAVPNTNKHAVEGSNPVWNEDVSPDYDNMSQGSGDSDLIGIEDSPEFNSYGHSSNNGISNAGYMPDHEAGFERRASVNPLSNMAGETGMRRTSMNPLSASFESLGDNDHIGTNSNFTFSRADSVPATEL